MVPRRSRLASARLQVAIWAVLLVVAVLAWFVLGGMVALVFLLAALALPWRRRTPARKLSYEPVEDA